MYTREQVIKGLQCCILHNPDDKPRCNDCPFDGNCVNRLKMAALEFLIKSDFEVVEEVLQRSKKHDWLGTGFSGEGYTLELLDVFDAPTIDFDGEGNIL